YGLWSLLRGLLVCLCLCDLHTQTVYIINSCAFFHAFGKYLSEISVFSTLGPAVCVVWPLLRGAVIILGWVINLSYKDAYPGSNQRFRN
uniref:Uncharacterized protein n=1 Tax=Sus scrofa TaxID=9823 RepID=A0A8D1NE46_PIG